MKECRLSDCCLSISDGDHLAPPKADEGIPFITIRNFDAYNDIDFTESMSVPEDYYDSLKNIRKPQKGDILYSVVGSFGIPVLIKNDKKFVFQRHIAILRPNPKKVDTNYLFQLMRSESFYAVADILAIGSAQRTISLTSLRRILIELPDLKVQQIIGLILSQYDDLIATKRKKIQVLEEMVMRTYREWFIHMRFPGYEHTPKVDGLPQGWQCLAIGDMLSSYIGGGWGEEDASEKFCKPAFVIRGSDIPSILQGIPNYDIYRYHSKSNLKSRKLNPRDIIFEISGGSDSQPLGRNCIITNSLLHSYGGDVICASFCKRLVPKQDMSFFLYTYLQQIYRMGLLDTFCVRTTGISNFKFEAFIKFQKVVVPSNELLISFNKIASPIYEEISTIGNQIGHISKMRDKLLPQLMSGKLEVKV
jgi:type I restriction enzyme S subunit